MLPNTSRLDTDEPEPRAPGTARRWILRGALVASLLVAAALVLVGRASAETAWADIPATAEPDETIALSASSSLISLVGVVVLAAAVVAAAITVEARSREEAEGELLGRA